MKRWKNLEVWEKKYFYGLFQAFNNVFFAGLAIWGITFNNWPIWIFGFVITSLISTFFETRHLKRCIRWEEHGRVFYGQILAIDLADFYIKINGEVTRKYKKFQFHTISKREFEAAQVLES
jgi:hypothetical protein